jgi:hypothetical protein
MITLQDYRIRDDDVAHLEQLLEEHLDGILTQQAATHDYSPDDLAQVRLRNARIKRALRLEDK